ncbi:MAG TPA: tyrosine-type recombinase/integrase [Kofleriaceae bacterium]|nr:tyrosine-type recombinase/integrase [Kofleriaceae bacterium]
MPDGHPLGPFVRRFLLEEVVADRNLTLNTQRSYRDSIRLLLRFLDEHHAIEPTRVTVEQITGAVARTFLAHLEEHRGNSVSTRNQRLAAIHSLFRFVARQVPELVDYAAQIHAIPLRRSAAPTMAYLEKPEIDALLAVPDRRRPQGQRDYALLLFLYNTGARATETAELAVGAVALDTAPSVRFLGKGRKTRTCPLWPHTTKTLRQLLGARLEGPRDEPVFRNVRGEPVTRFGIHDLIARTVRKAAETTPSLQAKRVSPHTLRHTTAVHLLRAGVDINTIRAWLGHVSLETTNRYAEVDLETKAKALETCAVTNSDRAPVWRKDKDLMAFLSSL